MTNKAPELLPCPFCGELASIREDSCHSTAFYVGCGTLGCFGCDHWDETQAEAVALWNTRTSIADAAVAAAYERAAQHHDRHGEVYKRVGNHADAAAHREHANRIRALATDAETDALEAVRREAERAGYERGVRESARKTSIMMLGRNKDFADRLNTVILALLDNPTQEDDT